MQLRDQSARAEARACAIGQHRRDVLPIEGPRIPCTAPRTSLLIAVPPHTRHARASVRTGLATPTSKCCSEPLPYLHGDCAHSPTSTPGLRSPAHICTGTGRTPCTSAPGPGELLWRRNRAQPTSSLHSNRLAVLYVQEAYRNVQASGIAVAAATSGTGATSTRRMSLAAAARLEVAGEKAAKTASLRRRGSTMNDMAILRSPN